MIEFLLLNADLWHEVEFGAIVVMSVLVFCCCFGKGSSEHYTSLLSCDPVVQISFRPCAVGSSRPCAVGSPRLCAVGCSSDYLAQMLHS